MGKIKSKNTKPEIILRKKLWSLGYRYRIDWRKLTGKPDIVFNKFMLVIFIDGEFWHGYNWEEKKKKIKSNRGFWIPKIERNIQRDTEVISELTRLGYTVLRFWEHEIRKDLDNCVKTILHKINKPFNPDI